MSKLTSFLETHNSQVVAITSVLGTILSALPINQTEKNDALGVLDVLNKTAEHQQQSIPGVLNEVFGGQGPVSATPIATSPAPVIPTPPAAVVTPPVSTTVPALGSAPAAPAQAYALASDESSLAATVNGLASTVAQIGNAVQAMQSQLAGAAPAPVVTAPVATAPTASTIAPLSAPSAGLAAASPQSGS
jgi:hypothetical protein